MVDLSTLSLFLLAALALFLSPGPNMAFVLSHGIAHGPRGGITAAMGIAVADLVLTLLTATGVTALAAAWPPSFDATSLPRRCLPCMACHPGFPLARQGSRRAAKADLRGARLQNGHAQQSAQSQGFVVFRGVSASVRRPVARAGCPAAHCVGLHAVVCRAVVQFGARHIQRSDRRVLKTEPTCGQIPKLVTGRSSADAGGTLASVGASVAAITPALD